MKNLKPSAIYNAAEVLSRRSILSAARCPSCHGEQVRSDSRGYSMHERVKCRRLAVCALEAKSSQNKLLGIVVVFVVNRINNHAGQANSRGVPRSSRRAPQFAPMLTRDTRNS
jgi:hypothetical protein